MKHLLHPLGLLLLWINPFQGTAQTTMIWQSESETHSFRMAIDTLPFPNEPHREGLWVPLGVEIKGKDAGTRQHIAFDLLHESYYDSTSYWKLIDMNFDGYMDLRVLETASYFQVFDIYLYQPETGQFVRDALLSNLFNPDFDPETRTVHSYWRVGLSEFGHALYEWHDGQIRPVLEEVLEYAPDDKAYFSTRRWVDGKLVEETHEEDTEHTNEYCFGVCQLRKKYKRR